MFKEKNEKLTVLPTFICIFAYFIIVIIEDHETIDYIGLLFVLLVFIKYLYLWFIKKE